MCEGVQRTAAEIRKGPLQPCSYLASMVLLLVFLLVLLVVLLMAARGAW